MRGRGATSVVASPVLVGAVTVLVVTVSVFLAYNANRGLPFVPTYDLSLRLPSASNLVRGDEVRAGGFRVGVVDSIKPATQITRGRLPRRSGRHTQAGHADLARARRPHRRGEREARQDGGAAAARHGGDRAA